MIILSWCWSNKQDEGNLNQCPHVLLMRDNSKVKIKIKHLQTKRIWLKAARAHHDAAVTSRRRSRGRFRSNCGPIRHPQRPLYQVDPSTGWCSGGLHLWLAGPRDTRAKQHRGGRVRSAVRWCWTCGKSGNSWTKREYRGVRRQVELAEATRPSGSDM